jgi:hypothetical protein
VHAITGDFEAEDKWLDLIRAVAASRPTDADFEALQLTTCDGIIPLVASLVRPPPPGPRPPIGVMELVATAEGMGRAEVRPPEAEGEGVDRV